MSLEKPPDSNGIESEPAKFDVVQSLALLKKAHGNLRALIALDADNMLRWSVTENGGALCDPTPFTKRSRACSTNNLGLCEMLLRIANGENGEGITPDMVNAWRIKIMDSTGGRIARFETARFHTGNHIIFADEFIPESIADHVRQATKSLNPITTPTLLRSQIRSAQPSSGTSDLHKKLRQARSRMSP